MKPPRFDYARPRSVEEAIAALAASGGDGKVLAGGQSLVPLLSMRLARPNVIVDLNRIPGLDYVRVGDGKLHIGALARHETVLRSAQVRTAAPLITEALAYVGHVTIRNRGTVCGSIAHADPAAELPAVMRALDAEMVVHGDTGTRTVPAEDFFGGYLTTVLEPDEILTEVRVPVQPPGGVAVRELSRRSGDFALVAVFATLTRADGVCTSARIGIAGTNPEPLRARDAEAVLTNQPVTAALLAQAGAAAATQTAPVDDIHAPAGYRRKMADLLTRRAVAAAWGNTGGGVAT
jgi:carbon-monoxide dehydrogenase medium subunit